MKTFKQFIKESLGTWKLSPSVDSSNYQIDDDFNNVANWKCNSYIDKNGYFKKKNKSVEFDKVGYVMFNISKHEFIPIAREDEHHTGYDLLEELVKNTNAWLPIYMIGTNYVYDKQHSDKAHLLFKDLYENGFISKHNITMSGSNVTIPISQFVETAKMEYQKGKMLPNGEKLCNDLKALALEYRKARTNPRLIKNFINKSLKLLKWFNDLWPNELLYADLLRQKVDGYIEKISSVDPDDGRALQIVSEVIFGFGFKNAIHKIIKTEKYSEKVESFFGDGDIALGIFNSISEN